MPGTAPPPGLDDFINSPVAAAPAQPSSPGDPQGGEPAGLDSFINDEEHGTLGQQAIAGVEGAARGATLGLSDLAETRLGIAKPEDIRGRMEANPGTSFVGNVIGGGALIGLTGGAAAPEEAAGAVASAAAGKGLGAAALGMGAEGALFGAGNAVTDYALGDTDLTAQKVLTDIGLGATLGVGLGMTFKGVGALLTKAGVLKGSVADVVAQAEKEAASKAGTADAIESTGGFKSTAPDIAEAADRLGAPLLEGQVSDDKWVQKAEDILINGDPTVAAIKRAKLYEKGWEIATKAVDDIAGEGRYTKAEIGNVFKDTLTGQIADESKPISEMYDLIKQKTQDIPLPENASPKIAKEIRALPEVRISPSSPEAKMADRVANELEGLTNVDDIKAYKSILNRSLSPTASSGEKRMAGILSDKLTQLEESSIERYALETAAPESREDILRLIEARKAANAEYKPFIEKVKTLAEQLGKRKVYGPQDAIAFIKDLTPEEVTQKLFSKNNSEFLKFFEKNFPEQSALMREYQKGALRDAAMKTGEFSPKVFFNKVNALEPEIRKSVFFPEELQKIKDAETYLRSFPKNFNPSGTAGQSAFRAFASSPTGAAIANARDFGLLAYIKAMGKLPLSARPNPVELGSELAQKFKKLNAVQNIADRTAEKIRDNSQAIFNGVRGGVTSGAVNALTGGYDNKVKRISELAGNPDAMMAHIEGQMGNLHQHLPNVTQGAGATMTRAVNFLNSKVPKPKNPRPLSGEYKPSDAEKSKFNKYYETVDNPISALKSVKNGTFGTEQMEALAVVHPQLLQHMQAAVRAQLNPNQAKSLSYGTRISLSKFLGEPLDEHMTGQAVASYQAALANGMPPAAPPGAGPPKKSSKSGIEKLNVSKLAATRTQELETDEA